MRVAGAIVGPRGHGVCGLGRAPSVDVARTEEGA